MNQSRYSGLSMPLCYRVRMETFPHLLSRSDGVSQTVLRVSEESEFFGNPQQIGTEWGSMHVLVRNADTKMYLPSLVFFPLAFLGCERVLTVLSSTSHSGVDSAAQPAGQGSLRPTLFFVPLSWTCVFIQRERPEQDEKPSFCSSIKYTSSCMFPV